MRRLLFLCCLGTHIVGGAAPLHAQDTVVVVTGDDPRQGGLDASSPAARRAVAIFNDELTTRFFGPADIGPGRTIDGSVGVLDGPATIQGSIQGDFVALNSDVTFDSATVVTGDIIVIGGSTSGLGVVQVGGSAVAYRAAALVRRSGDQLELLRATRTARRRTTRRGGPRRATFGADFHFFTGGTYNRVDGLPLEFGPRFRFGRRYEPQLRLEGWAIFRTGQGPDKWGYVARAEFDFEDKAPVMFGGRVADVFVPIENWKLPDLYIGLASSIARDDWRDYYRRRGGAAYLEIGPLSDLTFNAEVGWYEETALPAQDPFSLFGDVWRPNPPIDEGDFVQLTLKATYDSRPSTRSYRSGWYVSGEWERGRSDNVAEVSLPATIRPALPQDERYTYDMIWVDLRRYQRAGRIGQFSLRAAWAGTVGQDPLPVQRRLSVGGLEPMPGYGFREFACNETVGAPSNPSLCDRILFFQAEYRGSLSFSASGGPRERRDAPQEYWDWDDWDWDDWFWFDGPQLVLFGDAGTGWLSQNSRSSLKGDVGAGLEIGSMGLYAAYGFTGSQPLRIAFRIKRRF